MGRIFNSVRGIVSSMTPRRGGPVYPDPVLPDDMIDPEDTLPIMPEIAPPDPFAYTKTTTPDHWRAASIRNGMSPEAVEAALARVMSCDLPPSV